MPPSLYQPLPRIAFSRNEIAFVVSSDDYLAGVPALSVNKIEFAGEVPPDLQINVLWDLAGVYLTAKANPNDTGDQIPSGPGDLAHVTALQEWFAGNYFIRRDYNVFLNNDGANPALLLIALKKSPDYDLSPGVFGNVTISVVTPGVSPATKPKFMHHLQVWIREASGNGYLKAFMHNVSLDEPVSGISSIDIGDEILHSFLSPELPELLQPYARCTQSIRDYYCVYGQFQGTDPSVWKLRQTPTAFVNMGGLGVQASQQRNIITELCPVPGDPAKNRFLRHGGKNKIVRVNQPEWLTFINFFDDAVTAHLEVIIYNDDDTQLAFNSVADLFIPAYAKFQFQTGFDQLGITGRQAAGKRPLYYACRVKLLNGEYLTEAYAYVIEYKHRDWPKYFVYFNSYGAYQTIGTTGTGVAEYDRDKDGARLAGNQRSAAITGDFLECNISIQEKGAVNIGYDRAGRRNTALLRDFLLSPSIFVWKAGRLVPIGLNTKALKDAEDGQYVYASSFEYFEKYQEVNFTEDPAAVTDQTIDELLQEAGSPPIIPVPIPGDEDELVGGNIIVEFGDPRLSIVAGLQNYTAPYWLSGRSNYRIYATQLGRYLYTSEVAYAFAEGGFTINIDQFALQLGDQLIIWPFILNPDGE